MNGKKEEEERNAPLTAEEWEVVKANLHIVDEVVFKHFPRLARTRMPYLRSLGTPGLEAAVRTFDPEKGTLRSHAWMRIRGAILDGLEKDGSCAAEAIGRARRAGMDFAGCQGEGPRRQDDTEDQARERFRSALRGLAVAWKVGWIFGGHGDDAEAPLLRAARARAEEEALVASETLPDRDRQLIELRYRQGCTWPEVAAATGVPEGTLYHHHHAAMKRLAGRMRPKRIDPVE